MTTDARNDTMPKFKYSSPNENSEMQVTSCGSQHLDTDGAPLSPLQRIASGLIPRSLLLSEGVAEATVTLPTPLLGYSMAPVVRRLDLQASVRGAATTSTTNFPSASIKSYRDAIEAHTQRAPLRTPNPADLPPNVPIVATERFTSHYPLANELHCSRCDEYFPASAAFCHSCGGAVLIPQRLA